MDDQAEKQTMESTPPSETERNLIALAADAERKYLQLQQLLTSFLGNMPALSFIKDDEGRYLYASKSFASFFEVEPAVFLGKTDYDWLPADTAKQFSENDEEVRRTQQPIERVERVRKNQLVIESIVQKFPVWVDSPSGKRMYIGGIAIDITERQKTQERISQLAGDLESLAYAVSHEMQEPVSIIKSYQNLLAVRYRDRLGSDADAFINKCSEAATTLDLMVNELWSYARIKKNDNFRTVDASVMLAKALERLSPLIKSTNAAFTYDELPRVVAIEQQIIELFEHVIRNSLQHNRTQPHVQIQSERVGKFERFSITDNGVGIDPMDGSELFRLFRRSGKRRPDASGAGIGLAICARIIEHHGGAIYFQPRQKSGSTRCFTLAAAE